MRNPDYASPLARLKRFLLGGARDIRDPHLFHKLSLAAFFAWIGLGSDGLTSSCYGPEEAFLALGHHPVLGLFVALATVVTVFVITASYSQIVELFPGGGGGYLVASKLLSPTVGMVSGCALLVDYVLTITLSIASGADALFSFLPASLIPVKLPFAALVLAVLVLMNLRGVRESVVPLVPVFAVFLGAHAFTIVYMIVAKLPAIGATAASAASGLQDASAELGTAGMILLILRSYSMGAGTFTGIEAVSNGLPILREPKVQTARRTMRYMAVSLAFLAGGLMLGYFLYGVQPVHGKTLNATLFAGVTAGWPRGIAVPFVAVTLLSEAVFLFAAAQTGFLDGPRILANMSMDRWLPQQFSLLSERFVIKNGILIMGGAALILMLASGGNVKFLVTLYAINVFLTFLLSQLGMVRHWWRSRSTQPRWRRKLLINGVGLAMTGFILLSVVVLKFGEGGWITVLITGSLVAVCVAVKRFYFRTRRRLAHLDHLMSAAAGVGAARDGTAGKRPARPRGDRTAVLLVSGFNGTGLHTLFNIRRVFGDVFGEYVFMSAGIVDTDRFKGVEELSRLETSVREGVERYVTYLRAEGYSAEGVSAMGTDVADEIVGMAREISRRKPHCVFFGGQIVFPDESLLGRMLYNHTAFAVQRRLHNEGIPFLIMPVRVR